MTRNEELLASFDDVWSHRWESFEATMKNVSEVAAQYSHPAYANEEQEEGMPLPGSILWHLVHLTHCYDYYVKMIELRPNKIEEAIELPAWSTLADAIEGLRRSRQLLRTVIASLDESAIEDRVSNGDTVATFVRMIVRHDAWHSAQIAVAKRLYYTSEEANRGLVYE